MGRIATDAQIEAAARAICTRLGSNPDEMVDSPNGDHKQPLWMSWSDCGRDAAEAVLKVREKPCRTR